MALSISGSTHLVLQGESCRASITVQDSTTSINADPYRLTLKCMNSGGGMVFQDVWPTPDNRIVRTGLGQFYVDIGPATAQLDGSHPIGSTTLTVKFASPRSSDAWPTSGTLKVDFDNKYEVLTYSAANITAAAGTFTLVAPTTITHSNEINIQGANPLTDGLCELLLDWQIETTQGGSYTNSIDKVKVISARSTSFLPEFKLLIDKSRKLIAPSSDCYLGYSDAQLLSYLEGGLGTVNAYQPSLTFTFENFPFAYKQVLLDAGLITGVMSQQLYAIDTDIPNYNDQGTSFVIVHQPQLAAFLNQITQRLDRIIPMMKLQLIQPGSLHVQMGPDFRLRQLVEAAPSGSLFRNVFFKG